MLQHEEPVDAEETLSSLFDGLPPDQKSQMQSRLKAQISPPTKDNATPARLAISLPRDRFFSFEFVMPPSPQEIPAAISSLDLEKRDKTPRSLPKYQCNYAKRLWIRTAINDFR